MTKRGKICQEIIISAYLFREKWSGGRCTTLDTCKDCCSKDLTCDHFFHVWRLLPSVTIAGRNIWIPNYYLDRISIWCHIFVKFWFSLLCYFSQNTYWEQLSRRFDGGSSVRRPQAALGAIWLTNRILWFFFLSLLFSLLSDWGNNPFNWDLWFMKLPSVLWEKMITILTTFQFSHFIALFSGEVEKITKSNICEEEEGGYNPRVTRSFVSSAGLA